MYSYVALLEGNSSSTITVFENPDSANWGPTYHRGLLQQAIDGGLAAAGRYVVASPDGDLLNADTFVVEAVTAPMFRIKEIYA